MATRAKAGRGSKRKADAGVETVEQTQVVDGKKSKAEHDPENVIEGRRVLIEHWEHAEGLKVALMAAHPELKVFLNPQKPRKKSFDITLVEEGGEEVCLWSGIKKGPPARLKFPEPEVVVSALEKALKVD